ncbi:hypothetical protein T492DRAFT_879345, partial [Pavlovales sp. CCMP2436]
SRIWSKKGILKHKDKKDAQTDMMSVAFGPDGATYSGTVEGDIYIFHEQQLTRLFPAHKGAVTALWFGKAATADGLVKAWEIPEDGKAQPKTASSSRLRWATQIDGKMHDGVIDLMGWVTPGLEAAAHSLHSNVGDDKTLRVWDLTLKQMVKIRMLKHAGKSCAYSPDGKLVAVGLSNGGWLVVDSA